MYLLTKFLEFKAWYRMHTIRHWNLYRIRRICRENNEVSSLHRRLWHYDFPFFCNTFNDYPLSRCAPNPTLVSFKYDTQVFSIGLLSGRLFVDDHFSGITELAEGKLVDINTLADFYKAILRRDHGASLRAVVSECTTNRVRLGLALGYSTTCDHLARGCDRDILRWLKKSWVQLNDQDNPPCDEARLVYTAVIAKYKMNSPLVRQQEDVVLGSTGNEACVQVGNKQFVASDLFNDRADYGVEVSYIFPLDQTEPDKIYANVYTNMWDVDVQSSDVQRIISENRQRIQLFSQRHCLTSIMWHEEGAQIKCHICGTIAVWLYTLAAIAFSVCVSALNLMNRDNISERLVDGTSVATILLVSFFGLVKLTSEDPNAVRNRLAGVKVFRSMGEVCRNVNVTETQAKLLLDAYDEPARWVSDHNTCAMDITCAGSIQFSRGCTPTEVMGMGKLLVFNMESGKLRLYDAFRDRYRNGAWKSRAILHVDTEYADGGSPGAKDIVLRGEVMME